MIGIIGAMDQEVEAIKNIMTQTKEKKHLDMSFLEGKVGNKYLVLTQSGIGKVNAAITTSLLLSNYDIEFIINIGTAGGMVSSQETLDIVISENVIQYDFDTTYLDGPEGRGIVSKPDKNLGQKVKEAFESNNIDANIHFGDIISGDKFVGEDSLIKDLKDKFPQAIACEMEAGAIGQTAEKFGVPFIVIRALSDIVDHDNNQDDFLDNLEITSKRSAQMVEAFINKL